MVINLNDIVLYLFVNQACARYIKHEVTSPFLVIFLCKTCITTFILQKNFKILPLQFFLSLQSSYFRSFPLQTPGLRIYSPLILWNLIASCRRYEFKNRILKKALEELKHCCPSVLSFQSRYHSPSCCLQKHTNNFMHKFQV